MGGGRENHLNHHSLIDEIATHSKGEPTLLVTFNYDTLIEHALEDYRPAIDGMPSYVAQCPFVLIKLHGSVNWGRRVLLDRRFFQGGPQQMGQWLIKHADEYEPDTAYVWQQQIVAPLNGGEIAIPAIKIPTVRKETFECPEQHIAALVTLLPRVDRILTVGWKGTEAPFGELLRKHLARHVFLTVVSKGNNDANFTRQNLSEAGVKVRGGTSHVDGFSRYILDGHARNLFD